MTEDIGISEYAAQIYTEVYGHDHDLYKGSELLVRFVEMSEPERLRFFAALVAVTLDLQSRLRERVHIDPGDSS